MPFTPFHFGPHATIAFSLKSKVDLPVFLLANVVIDLEPLLVMIFNLPYPLHGYAHSFLFSALIGGFWGLIAFTQKKRTKIVMQYFKLPYETSRLKATFSGAFGAMLHTLFDAPLYFDIRPFYPLSENPLYGLFSTSMVYKFCTFMFVPAVILYYYRVKQSKKAQ